MSQERRPYTWLQVLMIVMTAVAVTIGALALHYMEARMVHAAGQNLGMAASEIADKLERLLFERYGDARMMARTFGSHMSDTAYLQSYLAWIQASYRPVYLWLGVTDARGRVLAATDPATVGLELGQQDWFRAVRDGRTTHVGDVKPYVASGGMDAVAFTAPVTGPRGEFLGAVTTRVGLSALEDIVTKTVRDVQKTGTFTGTMEYQFLARDGTAFIDSDLAHKGNVNLARLGLPSALVGPSPQPGYVEEWHKRRHVPVVTGYAFTEGTGEFHDLGWRVLVRMDRDEVVKPIHDVAWKLGVAGALIWLPLFGLLYWATGRLRTEYEQAERESDHARAAEATLRDSEQQMRVIVETALDAVVGMDEQGRITAWNPQAEVIFGWPHDDVIGRSLAETIIPPQHRESHERGLRRFLSTGQGPLLNRRIEVTAIHRDGREFPVELTVTAVRLGNRWVFNAFVRDIVHRRQTEDALLQAQTQLQQAQKMEAVGRLAGGIAHDFNNLLTIITGACHFLLSKLERGSPLRKEVEEVKQAGTRAAALTSQLLAFSRRQVLRLKEIDLNEVIADIENMLERLVGEDIILVTALEPSLGLVQADPAQIEQILMNLVANARDAMPAGGRLTIETATLEVDAAFALQRALPRPGAYVLLAVSDTGQGMDRETQAHIFEPFFTTKELGKGTGLGLATVYGSVKQSGGSIFVYSEPGQGTTFKIYLPRVGQTAAAEEAPPAPAAALPRGTETVLVVEDEPGVRAVILRTLRDLGYTVLEARHGLEALHLGSQPLARIHLLLTDVVMPQVSGREVAENLSQLHPALRVLYMSGYTDDAVVRHGILSDGMPFLQKPFTPDMLAQKVREVLDLPRAVS